MNATEVTAGLAESNSSLLLGLWRDSLHVTCGLTACTPGSAPGPTLGNEYGKTLPFTLRVNGYSKAIGRVRLFVCVLFFWPVYLQLFVVILLAVVTKFI